MSTIIVGFIAIKTTKVSQDMLLETDCCKIEFL